jgi:hypothetical protein
LGQSVISPAVSNMWEALSGDAVVAAGEGYVPSDLLGMADDG